MSAVSDAGVFFLQRIGNDSTIYITHFAAGFMLRVL